MARRGCAGDDVGLRAGGTHKQRVKHAGGRPDGRRGAEGGRADGLLGAFT